MAASARRIRTAVRVLLIDDAERTLLFRAVNPSTNVPFWFPPGGEIEAGETFEVVAARELREETGLTSVELGPEIWYRNHVFPWGDEMIEQRERWFHARVPSFEIDIAGWTEIEQRDITEHRWWTLDELRQAREHLVPRALPVHLERLLAQGPPPRPIDVGI